MLAGVPRRKFQVYVNGGVPFSTAAMKSTGPATVVRGAGDVILAFMRGTRARWALTASGLE
jgi:hypothetical protein